MTTDPKALTRQYMEGFAAKDLDGVMGLFHPDLLHILPQKCLQQLRFYLSRPPILPDEKQPS